MNEQQFIDATLYKFRSVASNVVVYGNDSDSSFINI